MLASLFSPLHRFLANPQLAWIMLWIGLAFLIVALLVMIRTSWGQSHPLRKCAALSLLAHLLLAGYATTVEIVTGSANGHRGSVDVMLVEGDPDGTADFGPLSGVDPGTGSTTNDVANLTADPANHDLAPPNDSTSALPTTSVMATSPHPQAAPPPLLEAAVPKPETKPPEVADPHPPAETVADNKAVEPPKPTASDNPPTEAATEPLPPPSPTTQLAKLPDAPTTSTSGDWVSGPPTGATQSIDPAPQGPLTDSHSIADNSVSPPPSSKPTEHNTIAVRDATGSANNTGSANTAIGPEVEGAAPPIASRATPQIYSDRTSNDRAAILRERGGSPEGESAVQAALRWLADNQSSDGRWDADRFGAGQERRVLDQDRQGAGAHADTGVTGLALLAFLGAGNTHLTGDFSKNVQHGLEFLINSQKSDGNLAGEAETYAFMYSHGMATFALSEAYAMTGDKRLEAPLRAAINYTIAAQIPITGGWRYRAHEPASEMGDTSQLGWQLMSLKSADMAGIELPPRTRDGIVKFIKSVSMGTSGGIASYQPGVRKPSRTMTAEALVCRQFMGMDRANPASNEAGDYLLNELPSPDRINLYYWYYGTLGMYQLQGEHWQRWNAAMQNTLIRRQRLDGDTAGSWDPDCIWGGYGGRVYSTSMSSLCLEVYYRYLPIYRIASKDQPLSSK